jgi:hypothetical protein
MIKTGSNVLTGERDATEQEIKAIEFRESRKIEVRPYVIADAIAEISGLQALYPENDLRVLLVIELEENLARFKAQDIDAMSPSELKKWVKWVDTIDTTFERAEESVRHAKRLLDRANLQPFLRVLENEDLELFRTYLIRLEQPVSSSGTH